MVPNTLVGAVEGRRRLDLGMPPTASLGDVLETLFKLYPKLSFHIASERPTDRRQMGCYLSGSVAGMVLYLFAPKPRQEV